MLAASLQRIEALPDDARVLDVGGWARPLARADAVIDLLPYETRGLYGRDGDTERFGPEDWTQRDICDPEPWPYADDSFDVAVCSHTLEDVRDPIRVCRELSRVARSGYIEVPSIAEELCWGVQGRWVGWSHHRWLVERDGPGLSFAMKPHVIHGNPELHLPEAHRDELDDSARVEAVWWEGSIPASEQVFIGAGSFAEWAQERIEAFGGSAATNPAPKRRLRPVIRRTGR
ncbi:MAG: class I SAM-dependent methyltransferase [Solirubrobacterales bacterium]